MLCFGCPWQFLAAKQKLGRKPTLTGQAITSDKDRQSIWQPARRKPKKEEKKVLIAEAIKVVHILGVAHFLQLVDCFLLFGGFFPFVHHLHLCSC